MHQRVLFLVGLGLLLGSSTVAAQDASIEFFEKKIRPVLVEHCYPCHSHEAKKHRGSLYLDSKAGLLEGGENGPAFVAGKPGESLLLKAVRHTAGQPKMPPEYKLPAEIVADLAQWIAMGAPDPRIGPASIARKQGTIDIDAGRQFWAFQPPKMPSPRAAKDSAWVDGMIDRLLLAKLDAKGIRPVQDADRPTLIRRAYFALIGLPPTPAQIDAFVNDPSPDAFARVVDELLASPHFGERWGRHWLDVARFSESSGGGRSLLFKEAWRYRDYVVQSFNSDKPYDRFLVEQIAGDLLPYFTPDQRHDFLIATGFLTLGPTNYERQDKPTLEMDVIDEQLDTIGKSMLGMTIGCARCHDHKFDPIPQKDYYALAGILKSTKTLIHDNVSRWVEKPLPMPPELELAVRKHDEAVAAVKKQIDLVRASQKGAPGHAVGIVAVKDLPGIVVDDAQARRIGPWKHSTFNKSYIGEGYLYDDRGSDAVKTLTFVPEFTKAGVYEVRLAYLPFNNRADKVPVRIFHADGDVTLHINQKLAPPIDGRFISLGKYRFEQGSQWFVMLSTEGTNGHVVADAVQFLPEEAMPAKPAAIKPVTGTPDLRQLEAQLKSLQATAPYRPSAMTVQDADKVEDFYVCIRGVVRNKGETVKRGVLQVATIGPPPVIAAGESGRRQLAEWIASKDNPLSARVMANRVWHHLFGAGLVRTVDNFGRTGELPSHPELLDFLAVRFVEQGWSVKKLIREVMLSHAYRLASSAVDADLQKKNTVADSENRLLWRMNRRRLEAEAIRDAILSIAGKLDRSAGGPSVKKGTTAERDYVFDDLRRSVYTPIFRNRLLELFEAFDFPDPNMALGKRNVSTVSTQALFLMNSPFVMAQAHAAAQQALAQPGNDDSRLETAYRAALGRPPTRRERELAMRFLHEGSDRIAGWERLYQVLFACVDFRYVE